MPGPDDNPGPSPGWARRTHFWATLIWIGPGAAASWLLKDSVPWVVMMSWYAIVVSHATGWTAGRAEDAAKNGA